MIKFGSLSFLNPYCFVVCDHPLYTYWKVFMLNWKGNFIIIINLGEYHTGPRHWHDNFAPCSSHTIFWKLRWSKANCVWVGNIAYMLTIHPQFFCDTMEISGYKCKRLWGFFLSLLRLCCEGFSWSILSNTDFLISSLIYLYGYHWKTNRSRFTCYIETYSWNTHAVSKYERKVVILALAQTH